MFTYVIKGAIPLLILIFISMIGTIKSPGAKGIYSDPIISKTSEQHYDTFLIDFQGVATPQATYWSLCNFYVDISDFKKTHPGASNSSDVFVYGGLQTRITDRVAIISFWELEYTENGEKKKLRANRVYPYGAESTFGNEGEGNNYIGQYNWETGKWYRFCLKSWDDEKTGNTFLGEWVENLSTGEWTLIAYFNTNLKNSFMKGGMSFFQENYNSKYFPAERKFYLRNTYVRDSKLNKWISLTETRLSYDLPEWKYDSAGTHEFGVTDDYFWGSSGLEVPDQEDYDADPKNPPSIVGRINQPDTPNVFNGIKILGYNVKIFSKKAIIRWDISSYSSPMLFYEITVSEYSTENIIQKYKSTRPDEKVFICFYNFNGKYNFKIDVTSIFDEKDSKTLTQSFPNSSDM